MGVQGFTPFLQKTFPQIIHKLPNRLRDLAGKRLVIDGTLITQRLHYAPSPHPFRHVLGWYNLAREMNENDISAICIFDGQMRSLAKADELGRRKATRRLDVSRGTLESLRTKRLQKLKTVMTGVRSLDEKGKSTIAEILSRLNPSDHTGTLGTLDGLTRVGERLRVLSGGGAPLVDEEQEKQLVVPEVRSDTPVYTPAQQAQDSSFLGLGTPGLGVPVVVPSAEDLKTVLLSSYRDFRSSISKVASFPLPESTSAVPSIAPVTTDENDVEEDLVLSKTQCELTLEEGKVWDELTLATSTSTETTALPTPPMPPDARGSAALALDHFVLDAAEDRLDALATRSGVVADSYQRRTCVPTKSTYLESREILEAMGVLCYEIEGEHEGEALASSLALRGLADYVVSEDSDVLVYGAPLIRNITSHNSPLTLIHGGDIREALDLTKDAYIDFAILLGTDFSQRIKGVGPSRAHKFIKEFGTIENTINSQTKHQPKIPRIEYLAQVNSARAIFSSLPPVPDQLRVEMMSSNFGAVDQAKVAVVMERCGLGRALMVDACWDYEAALVGNYFSDNPSMVVL